ncbi:zinc metalloprotease HtpX [Candidatus Falkowbacteria bacterium CG10_big_fil_rev_8_21_14_0_10_39_11]|uniref:Protease HtpX homolog n=1 Tax=Candidatus Falkowbacteria bacterium CG10_big_fil_rev_8_21_14_0_10_39_11 TaxID=1974565 RepID=A0A2H0V628_9BACT|nr:MAG: zinc metalloprotease HtpX [Candidatus Falkowbacteria bacterium CG10_big_fil_rev_8_21_14_0_10_39_11]
MYKEIDSNKRKSALLIIVFIAFVFIIGYFFYQFGYGEGALIIAAIIAFSMAMVSYFSGDKIALSTAGAKEITKADNQYVWNMVENLCITAGTPMPKVYIINDEAPNAFATGRDPEHASIAVTTGIVARLQNEELEGVIAHELGHVKNYDIRLMMVVIVLVGFIALLSDILLRMSFFGGRSRDNKGNAGAIIMIVGLILMILSPVIAKIIQLAISRKREYLADASGALLTRYPEGLASALEKISTYHQPMKQANSATAHLYIASPFFGKESKMKRLFSTHPPIADRVKKLREMGR